MIYLFWADALTLADLMGEFVHVKFPYIHAIHP